MSAAIEGCWQVRLVKPGEWLHALKVRRVDRRASLRSDVARTRAGLFAIVIIALGGGRVFAQAEIKNFTDPILIPSSGGHTGEIFDLEFTPEGTQLLSGGLDKLINVWGFENSSGGPASVIRPPYWRARAGAVYAMALNPLADPRGQRRLAVAGHGVESTAGNILIFLFPGRPDLPSGELVGTLIGHTRAVNALQFTPDGRLLVSAGNDGSIRLWDLSNLERPRVEVLQAQGSPVQALSCVATDEGVRLASGSADGFLRVWDVAQRRFVVESAPNPDDVRADPAGVAINTNCVAYSPDGRWIVIGRENGRLERHSFNLGESQILPTRGGDDGQSAVEALVISPRGDALVTCIMTRRIRDRSELPPVECDIELRAFPEGNVRSTLLTATNRARACAFSKDGRWLAFAGGDRQAVFVKDLDNLEAPLFEFRGQGQSIWKVGFVPGRPIVAWSRDRATPPGEQIRYERFDLARRQFVDVADPAIHGALETWQGWRVASVDQFQLRVVAPPGAGRDSTITLDQVVDGRWWAHTFLPPGPGHPAPALAVASEAGVGIYRLEDGRRTRVLSGHSGGVYTVAPSDDGVWLASGSSDQTVRLWLLDGCDRLPALGAELRANEPGAVTVERVQARGFAAAAGLQEGDVVTGFRMRDARGAEASLDLAGFLERTRDLGPAEASLVLAIRRGETNLTLPPITLRDRPVLSLFPGNDHEWVFWMPEGYYDTSISGDRQNLGWQVNPPWPGTGQISGFLPFVRSSDYFPAEAHAQKLRRPDILAALVATADPIRALEAREGERAEVAPPPAIQITAPALVAGALTVQSPTLDVRAVATAPPGRAVRSLRFWSNSRGYDPVNPAQPALAFEAAQRIDLQPGVNLIGAEASDDQGIARTSLFAVTYAPPPDDQEPPSRLIVRTIGVGQFGHARFPEIRFAKEDATRLAEFFVNPDGRPRFGPGQINFAPPVGPSATAEEIEAILAGFDRMLDGDQLGRSDTVIIAIESHFLRFDQGRSVILTTDAKPDQPPLPSAPAERLSQLLGRLANYGCTVMLVLDGIHERGPQGYEENAQVMEWVRQLYGQQNVIVVLASNSGPSLRREADRLGVLTMAIVESMSVRGGLSLKQSPDGSLTLGEFQKAVEARVEQLSGRRQFAKCFIPRSISKQLTIFEPRSAP